MFNIDDYLKHTYDPMERSLFGVRGKLSTGHGDFLFLDYLLCEKPQWTGIVELGTGSGLTTLYLAMAAALRQGWLVSFDVNPPSQRFHYLWPQCAAFRKEDVRTYKSQPLVKLLERENVFLLCDNGKKIDEVNTYAPHLASGSGFAVHDWGHEIRLKDIEPMIDTCGFEPLFHEQSEKMQSKLRAWVKR